MELETDLSAGYLMNGYLNYQLNCKTDQKIRNLNSVLIIRAYCFTLRWNFEHVTCSCFYCDLKNRLIKDIIGQKHQDLF